MKYIEKLTFENSGGFCIQNQIWVFHKILSLLPLARPYVHKNILKNLFILFVVVTEIQTDKQTYPKHNPLMKVALRTHKYRQCF